MSEGSEAGIGGLAYVGEPTCMDVQRRRAGYAAWSDEILEFDTAVQAADEVALTACLSTRRCRR